MGYPVHSVHSISPQPFGRRGVLLEIVLPTSYDYDYGGEPHRPDNPGNELYERCMPLVLAVLARFGLPGCHAFPLPHYLEDGTVARACGLYVPVERLSARVVMELRRELGAAVPGLTVSTPASLLTGPLPQDVSQLPRGEARRPTPHAIYCDPEDAAPCGC